MTLSSLSQEIRIALLPGLDGTGELFADFLSVLPPNVIARVLRYPTDRTQDISLLVNHALQELDGFNPDVILAESFSGPIAHRLVIEGLRETKLLILCASFIESPRPIGLRVIKVLPITLGLFLPIPEIILRCLCFDRLTAPGTIAKFRVAIAQVPRQIIAYRIRLLARLVPPKTIADVPCVLLRPTGDKLVPKESALRTVKYFKTIEVVDIAGPHFLLQSRPKAAANAVSGLVEKFLVSG